jgi:type IV secretory pathway VirB4 component
LKVISGRAHELKRMQQIISVSGADPSVWLPQFLSQSKLNGGNDA